MLKKTVTYTNFDGVEESKDLYFNLTQIECNDINLEYEEEGGLAGHIRNLMKDRVNGEIRQKPAMDFVKMLVDRAYGVRPKDDPSAFEKEDDNGVPLIKKFRKTLAYDAFMSGLLSGDIPFEEFVEGALPKISDIDKANARKRLIDEGYGDLVKLSEANKEEKSSEIKE